MSRIITVVLVALVALVGCKKEAQKKGDVLAKVNKTTLTLQEFNAEIPAEYAIGLTPDQKMGFVDRWVNTELVYQAALAQGLGKEEAIATKIEQLQKELLANELLQREMAGKATVTNEEAQMYFGQHEKGYNTEIKIAHILVGDPDTAKMVMAKLREGANFGDLAKRYSMDPSGQMGGVSGFMKRGDMSSAPQLEDAAFALEGPGQLSGIIQSDYGFHIVKLIARRPLPEPVKFEDVAEQIKNELLMNKQKVVFQAFIDSLKAKAKVEIHSELLGPGQGTESAKPEGN
jgi:parvulin-like peptidyl-prolyl isomerase